MKRNKTLIFVFTTIIFSFFTTASIAAGLNIKGRVTGSWKDPKVYNFCINLSRGGGKCTKSGTIYFKNLPEYYKIYYRAWGTWRNPKGCTHSVKSEGYFMTAQHNIYRPITLSFHPAKGTIDLGDCP